MSPDSSSKLKAQPDAVANERQPEFLSSSKATTIPTPLSQVRQLDRNRLLIGQIEVLEKIAAGRCLSSVLNHIARLVEEVASNLRCAIMVLEPEGKYLRVAACPSFPDEFKDALQALPVGVQHGTSGAAAQLKSPQVSPDITKDLRWANYKNFVLGYGVRASWSSPILNPEQRVLGTICIFYGQTHHPEPYEQEFVNVAIHLASIAIERARSEELLRMSEARFRALTEKSSEGITLVGSDGTFLYTSPAAERIHGFTCQEVIGSIAQNRIHPDDWLMLKQHLDSINDTSGASTSAQYRIKHKNNSWIWIEATLTNMLHEPGVNALVINFRDIAARKQVETDLRASEELYRSLVSALDEGIIMLDRHLTILTCNASAERILGLSRDQMTGKTSLDPSWRTIREDGSEFPPETHPVAITLQTGKPFSSVIMGVHRPDDSLAWISINSQPLFRLGEAEPYAVVASFTDITERKKVEAEIRASEERFSTMFQSNPCAMTMMTYPEGRIVNSNEAWLKAFGHALNDVVGRTTAELKLWLRPDQREEAYALLEKDGFIRNMESVFVAKDGSSRYFLLSAELIEFNQKTYLLVACYDISERKRAEWALRESEEHYRLLFEHSFAGIARMTADGTLVACNEAMAHMLGCHSPEELIQTDPSLFYVDLAEQRRLIEELLVRGSLKNREFLMKRLDGSLLWTLINASVFRSTEESEPMLEGVILDITERKQTEQQLQQVYQQSRTLLARLETIREEERIRISREIHDNLGQILTGLKLDFSWLEKRLVRSSDEGLVRKTSTKMNEIADLLEEAIQTVRDIATELRPSVLDTLGLRAAIQWQAKEFERRTGTHCIIELGREPKNLSEDKATALFRIFQEILTNITRHAKASKVKIGLAESNGELLLTVQDNGVGITEEQRRNTKSLGLLGMRERALIFGGSVTVKGEPKRGTTVQVSMPLDKK
ncbi:MAG: PAS domain S-box protein [Acidobacteria bacterium]|nr:PAS domain S-box protein [Acidobacteriota bacterium]